MHPDDPWLEAAASVQDAFDAETRDEAYEVFVAEAARVRLVDRVGLATVLLRCGLVVSGTLEPDDGEGVAGHLTVHDSAGRTLIVPSQGVLTMTGTRANPRTEAGTPPRPLASWLREASLADYRVHALTRRARWTSGRAVHVGADHLDLLEGGVTTTLAFSAVDAWWRH